MSKEKLGSEPAYPCEVGFANGDIQEMHQNGNSTALHNGMSKRFYAACAAMQGMLANPYPDIVRLDTDALIRASYSMADELLRQENE